MIRGSVRGGGAPFRFCFRASSIFVGFSLPSLGGKLLCVVLLLLSVAGARADSQWEAVTHKGIPCVSFDSFCRFYGFTPNGTPPEVEASGPLGTLKFSPESRIFYFNGVRYWMCFGFMKGEDERFLLSRVDVSKTFDPVLRPSKIKDKEPVLGVLIDPGHGGHDRGAVARTGLTEKALNLRTARALKTELEKLGLKVALTRDRDEFIELKERARKARAYPGFIFVSIHYNKAGNREARGVETFCMTPQYAYSSSDSGLRSRDKNDYPGNNHDAANMLLASLVQREISKLHPEEADRGVKRARFSVLRNAIVPAILIEGGFLSNKQDLRRLSGDTYIREVSEAMATAIGKYAKLMEQPKQSAEPFRLKFRPLSPSVGLRPVSVEDTPEVVPPTVPDTHEKEDGYDPLHDEPEDGRGVYKEEMKFYESESGEAQEDLENTPAGKSSGSDEEKSAGDNPDAMNLSQNR